MWRKDWGGKRGVGEREREERSSKVEKKGLKSAGKQR